MIASIIGETTISASYTIYGQSHMFMRFYSCKYLLSATDGVVQCHVLVRLQASTQSTVPHINDGIIFSRENHIFSVVAVRQQNTQERPPE